MPIRTNRHVILSHGGKHGVTGRTILKGGVVPGDVSQHIPPEMIDSTKSNPGKHGPVANAQKAPPKIAQVSAKQLAAKGYAPVTVPVVEAAAPELETADLKLDEAVADAVPSAPSAPEPRSRDDTPSAEVAVPQSKRALKALRKADAFVLAGNLALNVPEDASDITLRQLQRMLAEALGL
jgi:hypothetical protein